MKVKRFLLKAFFGITPIVVIILCFVIPAYIAYQSFKTDELIMQEKYQEKKDKYEQLEAVARSCIKEESGINIIEGLNTQNIKYEIYDDGENIIFCYYLIVDDSSYYTEVILSRDFKILDEKGGEFENFETFKKMDNQDANQRAVLLGVVSMIALGFILIGINILIGRFLERRKARKTQN